MGRPKVRDSMRRRAAVACRFCRANKKKCSATVPCTQCQLRGLAASCSTANASPDPSSLKVHPSSPANPLPTPLTQRPVDVPSPASPPRLVQSSESPGCAGVDGGSSGGTPVGRHLSPVLYAGSRARKRTHHQRALENSRREPLPHSQMLLNLRGEQVYIGKAASLSFLQLVREIVTEHIGPSQFSHNDQTESMLEAESAPVAGYDPISPPEIQLDFEQMILFSHIFKSALDGLMDIFAPSEVKGLLLESHGPHARYRNPYKRATVELIVAIGAQCESPESAVAIGQPYFRHAQKLASSEILEDPSVDMVRVFLLMAYYMLGSCRRNAAFMYIGIAARAAVTLGLHSRDSYSDMSTPKFQLRLRIWVSLCILDMIVSAILGRPAATAALRSDLEKSLDGMAAAMRGSEMDMGVLMASYKILGIISNIIDKLYKRKQIPGVFIEQYLEQIKVWKQEYSSCIQGSSTLDPATPSTKSSIGNIHVSCIYYFAVTLVTRPILIPNLTGQPGCHDSMSSQMAEACVDAAIYLVQTCEEAQEAGLLLGNMCILKALIFIAGLILGLQSFCKRQIDYSVEKAFSGAIKTLDFLAVQSPQAAQYRSILTLLSTAIVGQREKLASAGRSQYVSRLFNLNESKAEAETRQLNDSRPPPPPPPRSEATDSSPVQVSDEVNSENLVAGLGFIESNHGTSFNWDHLDISEWDDFLHL
ncbi:hypothetical protein BP6252_14135 [Coleophoma cylindrospora]|uniref:Zn(2)-C6 fungal-type domain-containing protein n=1 Tax=Coleophoma cylindrospora TaxID=1849047 RepID=A0A3D8Q3N2_9HELO|nr:hypothetical protein BP6252_14135 [Coleophoma cylindrospora]